VANYTDRIIVVNIFLEHLGTSTVLPGSRGRIFPPSEAEILNGRGSVDVNKVAFYFIGFALKEIVAPRPDIQGGLYISY